MPAPVSIADSASPLPKAEYVFPLLLAVLLVVVSAVYCLFLQRTIYFDEVGLHNPIYTYLHSGKITYPAHGEFDSMTVHPPTHYFLIASLMRLGLDLFHAAGLLHVVLFAVAAGLLVFSRFSLPLKLGFLFGIFVASFVWHQMLTIRPDLDLALSWIAGLIALETGRLADWDPKRLAIGGFFLTLASAAHYPGITAFLGAGVFLAWAALSLPRSAAIRSVGAIVAGGCVVGIPFLVFFVVPHLGQILSFGGAVNTAPGSSDAFARHLSSYQAFAYSLSYHRADQPVLAAMLGPAFALAIPLALFGCGTFALFPDTRGLAAAAAPHLLFILFGSRAKMVGYSGYFVPEVMLYLSATAACIVWLGLAGAQKVRRTWLRPAVTALLTAALAGAALIDSPTLAGSRREFRKGLYDLELARAAGQRMLGPNAFVGTTSAGVWYTAGAHRMYFLTNDILYPKDLSGLDLRSYFSLFDALATDPHQTWATWNDQRISLTSAYRDGVLSLRGFYFGDGRGSLSSGLSYLLFSVNRPPNFVGFGLRGDEMYRFEELDGGGQIFLSAVCPLSTLQAPPLQSDFFTTFFLPTPDNADPRQAGIDPATPVIRVLLVDRESFLSKIKPALDGCTVRDRVPGEITRVSRQEMLRGLRENDSEMEFVRDLRTDQCRLVAADPLRIQIPLTDFAQALDRVIVQQQPGGLQIISLPQQWAYAAKLDLQSLHLPPGRADLSLRVEVRRGTMGFGVLNSEETDYLQEEQRSAASEESLLCFSLPSIEQAGDLIVRTWADNGVISEVLIKEASVLVRAKPKEPALGSPPDR